MRQPRRHFLHSLLASAACVALPAFGHDGADHATPPATGTGKQGSAAPLALSAVFDAQGRLWVARVEPASTPGGAGKDAQIMLQWSSDGGLHWSAARPVLRTPEAVEANGEGRPKIAFGPSGQVYVSFTRPMAKPHTGDIRFVRSLDDGMSFGEPVTLQSDRAVTGHRFDSMIVDRTGRVYVAWIDKRDGDAAKAAQRPYRGAAIYYTVSHDHGASFAPDRKLADHCCECCRIALSINADGAVVAMWRHVFEPNERDHAMAIIPATGAPAGVSRVSFDHWRIDACPHHGPSMAFDAAGRRHQVWFSAGDEQGGVFYAAASAAGGLASPVRLGSVQASHGEVAAAGQHVVAVWKEYDGRASTILVRQSFDGGVNWKEQTIAASKGNSDHPHLAQYKDAIWLVWNTELDALVLRRIGSMS